MKYLSVIGLMVLSGTWVTAASAQSEIVVSSIEDRTDLAVTIYNHGVGLVRETRRVSLSKRGQIRLDFRGVAPTIRAPSVALAALGDPRGVAVIEQSYRYDVLSPDSLTSRAAGLRISVQRVHPGTGGVVRVPGEVLADFKGMMPVVRTAEGITYYGGSSTLGFGSLPERWVSEPMLSWLLDVRRAGDQVLGVSYLASGMSWSADYLLVLGKQPGDPGTLVGWITLENRSGASFESARLSVVAGTVNEVEEQEEAMDQAVVLSYKSSPAGPRATRSALADYHLYDIPNATSLPDQSSKQVTFLASNAVRPDTRYVMDASAWWRSGDPGRGATTTETARVELRFDAKADQGLGVPMPAGNIRVFAQDRRGQGQFIGQSPIGHTPRDETVKLRVGAASDLRLERRLMAKQRLGRLTKDTVSYRLRNAKPVAVEVEVVERAAKLDHATIPATHPDARTTLFTVKVPAGEEVVWQAEYTEGWQ